MPAVVTIGPEQRKGSIRVAYKKGAQVVEETYNHLVTTDIPATREEIIAKEGFPSPGISISPSELGKCLNFSLERDEGNILVWHLEVNYSSNIDEDTGGSGGGDPKLWVPVYESVLEPYIEYIVVDLDGRPIVNGAGTPYEGGLPVEKDIMRWDFWQLEDPSITDEQIADRNNTINSVEFKGRGVHTLLLKIRRSTVGFYFNYPCRMVEYSLLWKPSNWHAKVPNHGQGFLNSSNDKILAYRYKGKEDNIENGPLGQKHYTIAELEEVTDQYDFTASDYAAGKPSGGSEVLSPGIEETRVALMCDPPKSFFIEYRNYNVLDFFDFLRLPS